MRSYIGHAARSRHVDAREHSALRSRLLVRILFWSISLTSTEFDYAADLAALEPIREVLDSGESDVIPYWASDSLELARCGPPNTAWPRTAVAFVTRAI